MSALEDATHALEVLLQDAKNIPVFEQVRLRTALSALKGVLPLSFQNLSDVNVDRCNSAFPHKLLDWSITDWCCALAGEAGEACNVAKKIRRGDSEYCAGFTTRGMPVLTEHGREALAMELADVVCYADLTASWANIDLGEAVRTKFNIVSERRRSRIKL